MRLVDRIRQLAKEHKTNISALERDVGIGNGVIARWEKSSPSADKLIKVADYFGVSVDYLLGREEQPQNEKSPQPKNRIEEMFIGAISNLNLAQLQYLLDKAEELSAQNQQENKPD